ncbi:MAG: hypothetical protein K5928_03455 [Prevotella sp.]|nr:hypothetical protein [Prevotella sp.]
MPTIHNQIELMEQISRIGLLPLLDSGIAGYSAEAMADADCRYTLLPDGGWDWPLWKWKGPVLADGSCVYGKFFAGKAGFVSREWWPDFCNHRRHTHPAPAEGSVEEAILLTLAEQCSLITRELRAACGFTGRGMRSRFDAYVTRLEMGCRIVTADFVYPVDKHNREYGWGWSLLTTPEQLMGREACRCAHTPQESYSILCDHLRRLLPSASEQQIARLLK